MRTTTPAALPLFRSEFQLRLLALLLLQFDRLWTAPGLQKQLGATAASVHRELQRALSAGIITRESVGRSFQYRAEPSSPLFEPLQALLERTVGIESDLRRALEGFPGVEAAVIHGSYARGDRARPQSDVDLLVLGEPDFRALRARVRKVERRAARQVDALVYSPKEFRDMLRAGNSFAKGVIRGPIKPLVGDLNAVLNREHR